MRKRKELELQILTESIRLWEGDDIKTLGSVLYMSQVLVQSPGSEVLAKDTHQLPRQAAVKEYKALNEKLNTELVKLGI